MQKMTIILCMSFQIFEKKWWIYSAIFLYFLIFCPEIVKR
mgnify:CR=1 FL=1